MKIKREKMRYTSKAEKGRTIKKSDPESNFLKLCNVPPQFT